MGATREFTNEYVRLVADRMTALAQAFHGLQQVPATKEPGDRPFTPSQPRLDSREKVRAQA